MDFGQTLKNKRLRLGLTQESLAEMIHVTRQTISRWENGSSYPNLDTVVILSDLLDISLEELLKGDANVMVKSISDDVRNKHKYKSLAYFLAAVIIILSIFFIILGIGRANQISVIDKFNPFLTQETGYAQLPKKHTNKIDSLVYDDAFGNGEWLNFAIGPKSITNGQIALVRHKGSYVSDVRLLPKENIPVYLKTQLSGNYETYSEKIFGNRTNKSIPWWPFN